MVPAVLDPSPLAPVRCFLSYTHADDKSFKIVDALSGTLSAMFEATTGRALEVFVDRDSIGWGDDWRKSISTSVQSAVFFIPLFTARYVSSESCREEFLAFYSKSEELGVTELILPLVLFGSDLISVDSPDEIVRIIASLQYRTLEEGWTAGYDSSEWRQIMRQLASELRINIEKVEQALVERESETATAEKTGTSLNDEVGDSDSSGGAFDLLEGFQDAVEAMAATAGDLNKAVTQFGAVPQGAAIPGANDDVKSSQKKLLFLAHRFQGPAKGIETHGRELNAQVVKADSNLRSLIALADESGLDELKQSVREGVESIVESLGDMKEVGDQMAGLLDSMRPAEVLNVSLRKSLAPARVGITNVRDAMKILVSWQQLIS